MIPHVICEVGGDDTSTPRFHNPKLWKHTSSSFTLQKCAFSLSGKQNPKGKSEVDEESKQLGRHGRMASTPRGTSTIAEDGKGPMISRLAVAKEEEHYRLSKRNVLEQAAGSPGRVQNLAKMESSQSILLNSHGGARVAPEEQDAATPRPGPITKGVRIDEPGERLEIQPFNQAPGSSDKDTTPPPGYTLPGLARRKQASPLRENFTGGSFRKPKGLSLHFGSKRDIMGRESRMVTFGGTKAAVPLGPLSGAKRQVSGRNITQGGSPAGPSSALSAVEPQPADSPMSPLSRAVRAAYVQPSGSNLNLLGSPNQRAFLHGNGEAGGEGTPMMGTPLRGGMKYFGQGVKNFGGSLRNWRASEDGQDVLESSRRTGVAAALVGGRGGRKVSTVQEEEIQGMMMQGGGRGSGLEAHREGGGGGGGGGDHHHDDQGLVCPSSRVGSPYSAISRGSVRTGKSPRSTRVGRSLRYNDRYLGTPQHGGADGDRRFLNRSIDERMAMSGVSLSYAGDGCASKWGEPVSVSDKAIEAMSNTKDRQHDELQAILDVLDEVRAEPFASMNEFERLKVAQIAFVEVKEHGTVLLKRREAATKVYLLLKGRCSVFDFTEGMDAMWKQREEALEEVKQKEAENKAGEGSFGNHLERKAEQWDNKEEAVFGQLWKYTDGYGEILWKQLPEGSRAWEMRPGAAFGGGVGLPLSKWGGGGGGTEGRCVQVVCSPGNSQQCVLLSLDRSQMQTIADMALGKFAEKAQVLRSIKLCAGVSRLAIKMLAMNVKEEKIAPNKIIVEQGTAPTAIFVIRRGFVRVVRRVRKHRDMFGSVHRSVNPKDAGGEAGGGKDEGRMFECGLLGPTQFFGAISVLELGKMNSMPAYLVSCRTMDVYTLSRLDVGKVSYDDREIMLANAKRQENMIVKDDHEILADYKTGQKWEGFREEIMGQVVISKQVKRKDVTGVFVNGSSGGVRKHVPDEMPLEQRVVSAHPFETLGSVVIGYYNDSH